MDVFRDKRPSRNYLQGANLIEANLEGIRYLLFNQLSKVKTPNVTKLDEGLFKRISNGM